MNLSYPGTRIQCFSHPGCSGCEILKKVRTPLPRSKLLSLQRIYTDGQVTYKEKLNKTIREMQTKTIMRYHFTPFKMTIIKKSIINKSWRDVEERKPSYTVGGNVNWYSHYGERYLLIDFFSSVEFSRSVVSDSLRPHE